MTLAASVDISVYPRSVVNAGTICVRLHADRDEPKIDRLYVAFEGHRYRVYRNPYQKGRNFYALIPVSYYTKPKESRLVVVRVVRGSKHYHAYRIRIKAGSYRSEKLHVAPSRAKISPQNRRRITREQREAMRIYRTETPGLFPDIPLSYPLQSKITSAFGTRRLFNGILKSYHSGTDFRAAVGTPIRTVGAGRVVLAKRRFFAGNSIIIDHGEGLFTGYYHLSRFAVSVGDFVEAGDLLGYAGATGRVTGPHLHFSARVHGVQVDPLQFLQRFNLLFKDNK